jgi:hypothetical protein
MRPSTPGRAKSGAAAPIANVFTSGCPARQEPASIHPATTPATTQALPWNMARTPSLSRHRFGGNSVATLLARIRLLRSEARPPITTVDTRVAPGVSSTIRRATTIIPAPAWSAWPSRGIRRAWLNDECRPCLARAWRAVKKRAGADGKLVKVGTGRGKQQTLRDDVARSAINGRDDRSGAMGLRFPTELLPSK